MVRKKARKEIRDEEYMKIFKARIKEKRYTERQKLKQERKEKIRKNKT